MVRRVLVSLGAGLLLVACGEDASPPKQDARDFFFYVSADLQINVPEWGLAGLDTMVATMNRTPGREWPFGGRVDTPRGVIVPGDLVDDIDHSQNWDAYKKYFDPGGNATLHFPVFAGIGNHGLSDSTAQQFSYVERAHIRRNERRPAPLNLGPKGYHYSWDWSDIHFVCLNIFSGDRSTTGVRKSGLVERPKKCPGVSKARSGRGGRPE